MKRNILGDLFLISALTLGVVFPAMAGSDLYVSEFQLSPDPPVQGQPVQVRIGIYNRGNTRSGKYQVAWWPGEKIPIAKTWMIDGSNARGGRILTYTYPGYKSWYSRLVTKVAIKHAGTEDNVDNNIFRKTIRVVKSSDGQRRVRPATRPPASTRDTRPTPGGAPPPSVRVRPGTPPPAEKTFSQPKYNGYRLDWCRIFEHECGEKAATAFCRANKYRKAVKFAKDNNIKSKTMTIGQNAVCDPRHHGCDSFKWIKCKK